MISGENVETRNGPNIIILSNSGKPLYWRYGTEEDVSNTCALLQAILSSFENNQIRSFKAGQLLIVVSIVKNITLVAISENGGETEIFLRLLLEYVYAQIIFTLTDQVQQIVLFQKNCDLISTLGPSATKHLSTLLDEAMENPGALFTAAVPILLPLDYQLREHASKVLQTVGNETSGLLYGALIVGDKLVTLVQPKFRPHQLFVTDIHLILSFIKSQPHLSENESWFPVCLPLFHSDGYIYAFTTCLHAESGLILMLMSTDESQEQLNIFRVAATKIERLFCNIDEKPGLDVKTLFHPINPNAALGFDGDVSPLYQGVTQAVLQENQEATFKKYCTIASCYHFVFRLDVSLPCSPLPKQKNKFKSSEKKNKVFPQCISPSLPFPFVDNKSKKRVWNIYQRLTLRLKLGSASTDSTMSAYDNIQADEQDSTSDFNGSSHSNCSDDNSRNQIEETGIRSSCPAINIIEPKPPLQGISYILDESELFFALNGSDFVLLAIFPASMDIKVAASSCAKLMRQLIRDEKNLFLEKPLTWRQ